MKIAIVLLLLLLPVTAHAIEVEAVPYIYGNVWSDAQDYPQWVAGLRLEGKRLCASAICRNFELVAGYQFGMSRTQSAGAVPCNDPNGCATNDSGFISGMTRYFDESTWTQSIYAGIQGRIKLLEK